MAKRRGTLRNVPLVNGQRVLYLSVQPPSNGGYVSLWDRPKQQDRGDARVVLALTEEQYQQLCAASQDTFEE